MSVCFDCSRLDWPFGPVRRKRQDAQRTLADLTSGTDSAERRRCKNCAGNSLTSGSASVAVTGGSVALSCQRNGKRTGNA